MRLFLLLILLFSAPARAATWDDLYRGCDDFIAANFDQLVLRCRAWQDKADKALEEQKTFTEKTCPAYYQKKQGDESIKSFTAEKQRVDALVLAAGTEGKALSALLEKKFADLTAHAQGAGMNFTGGRCGKIFFERKTHVTETLKAIEKRELGIDARCEAKSLEK